MPSLQTRNWNGCGKSDLEYTIRADSGCTLAVIAITGRNQNASESDPACLLGAFNYRLKLVKKERKKSLCLCMIVCLGFSLSRCLCLSRCLWFWLDICLFFPPVCLSRCLSVSLSYFLIIFATDGIFFTSVVIIIVRQLTVLTHAAKRKKKKEKTTSCCLFAGRLMDD